MIPNNQYWLRNGGKVAATTILTHTLLAPADGTIVAIGTRTYTYDAFGPQWISLVAAGYNTVQDAIAGDTGATDFFISTSNVNTTNLTATVAGAVGNSISTTVTPAVSGLSFPNATFTGGIG